VSFTLTTPSVHYDVERVKSHVVRDGIDLPGLNWTAWTKTGSDLYRFIGTVTVEPARTADVGLKGRDSPTDAAQFWNTNGFIAIFLPPVPAAPRSNTLRPALDHPARVLLSAWHYGPDLDDTIDQGKTIPRPLCYLGAIPLASGRSEHLIPPEPVLAPIGATRAAKRRRR